MPLGPNALTTWERARDVFKFAADMQPAVEFLIDSVSASANRIAGRALKARAYPALILDGCGDDTLLLPEYPIQELRHLYIDASRAFGPATEVLAQGISLRKASGIVKLYSGRFPAALDSVKVDATLGYDLVPADLELAVLECVGWNQRRLESGTVGTRAMSMNGAVTTQYEISIPLSAMSVFEDYRRPR